MDTEVQRKNLQQSASQFKNLFADRMPVLQNYEDFANSQLDELIGQIVPGARDMFRQATNYFGQYEGEVAPAISEYMSEARGYDTGERREDERARAMTDVREGAEGARQQSLARLESYGIDPSQTRGAALDANLRLATALAQVGAGKEAERNVEETGMRRRGEAIKLGSQLYDAGQGALKTGTSMLGTGLDATNATATNFANILGTPQTLLGAKSSAIMSSVDAKSAETAANAAKGAGGAGFAQIGRTVGTIGGGVVGGVYGGPVGAAAGSAAGGALGGAAGGAAGGGGLEGAKAGAIPGDTSNSEAYGSLKTSSTDTSASPYAGGTNEYW